MAASDARLPRAPDSHVDQTVVRARQSGLEQLDALTRVTAANAGESPTRITTVHAPESLTRITLVEVPEDDAPIVPEPPPTPRFAPPLPVPPREAVEHLTGVRRRVAPAPAAIDVSRPHTLQRPTIPMRRFPWAGVATLALAAIIGAAVGWVATPYVYGTSAPSARP